MLQAGQVFEDASGTRIVVRENSPERISIERVMPPGTGGGKGSKHRHTETHESFVLVEGAATATVGDHEHRLERSEVLDIPLGTAHVNPHTSEDETATIVQTVTPGTRAVEVYFESWLHWLAAGKTLPSGEPTTLQLAAITQEGGFGGTWLAGPPVFLQRLGLPVLGLIARLTGTRAVRVPVRPEAERVAG
jgi:mannose-6-phosphate isomerase-like protein (cupin superfamily)